MSRTFINSNINWLGKIPDNWTVAKVKNKFFHHKNIAKEEAINFDRVSLTLNGVILRNKEDVNGLQPEDFYGYQIVNKDDIIFKLIDLENVNTSRVGRSNYNGITSPAYILLHEKDETNRYYDYYFKNLYYQEVFNNLGGNGVRSAINKDDLLNIPLLIPPNNELKKIVDYLDDKCFKIDQTISGNNKVIDLLEEYKKTVITNKTSLGIPTKIKYIGSVKGRIGFKGYSNEDIVSEDAEGRALSIGGTNIMKTGKMSYEKNTYISAEKYLESPEIMLNGGEILMTKVGAGCGENSIYEKVEERVTINPNVMMLKVDDLTNSKYVNYALLNSKIRNDLKIISTSGGAQPAINQEHLKNILINLPDKKSQDDVVLYLDKICTKIDSIIEYRKRIIEKLEEYKKSLIYEVVTGKKEV